MTAPISCARRWDPPKPNCRLVGGEWVSSEETALVSSWEQPVELMLSFEPNPGETAMRKPPFVIGIAVVLVQLVGCVTSETMLVGNETFAPRPDDHVIHVYLGLDAPVALYKSVPDARSTDNIPSNATIIGRIDTQGDGYADWSALVKHTQKEARTMGGDGIVIGRWGSHVAGSSQYGGAYLGKNLSIAVIRYR